MKRLSIRYVIKIAVPIILLSIVFSHIEIGVLLTTLRKVNLALSAGALLMAYLSNVLLSTWRWKMTLSAFYQIHIPYPSLLRYFWEGVFIGYFVPGGVGSDVHRVVKAARHTGGYEKNIAAIVGEKLLMFIGNAILLMVIYPLVLPMIVADPRIEKIMTTVYIIGTAAAICSGTLFICLKVKSGQRLLTFLRRRVNAVVTKVMQKTRISQKWHLNEAAVTSLVKPFFRYRNQFLVVGFTLFNRIVCAVGGWMMLLAVGVDLPILIHVFVWTLMFLIFMLPISVGTLGIREGTFIILFGLFGVGTETALAASFVAFVCLLITTMAGGVLLLVGNMRRPLP
jgi:uncharacterized protein (TIRG00374 family)